MCRNPRPQPPKKIYINIYFLKGWWHEIEKGYNRFQAKDIKSSVLLEHNVLNSFCRPFHVLNRIKACFANFSFDSNSGNDEWQPQVDFLDWCCTSLKESSLGMSLLGWPTQRWRQLEPDYRHDFKLSAIGTVPSACLIYLSGIYLEQWSPVMICHCH
jgi:hypothetical protein